MEQGGDSTRRPNRDHRSACGRRRSCTCRILLQSNGTGCWSYLRDTEVSVRPRTH